MKQLMRVPLCLGVVMLAGCGSTTAMKMDAGEPPAVEYEGEAGGSPPDFVGDLIDAGNKSPIDAGVAVVDNRCCILRFGIPVGHEPANAVGSLVGEVAPLDNGIPLTRVDAGYTASACFPMMSSTFYWYQFEYMTGDAGSGGLHQGDGGYLVTIRRYSPLETNYAVGDERKNFIPSVMNCSELDAGQGP